MLSTGFRRWVVGVSMLAGGAVLIHPSSAQAFSPCTIAFNDHAGLSGISRQYQAYGYMYPNVPAAAVYMWYTNACSGDRFVMDEDPATSYGHFHIPPSDPTINCFTSNSTYTNVFGRTQANGSCLAVDPLNVDRTVFPHGSDERLRIIDYTSSLHWRPTGIDVLSTSAIVKVTIQEANGQYWTSGDLTPGRHWTIGWNTGPGTGAVAAWVATKSGQTPGAIFDIDNIAIDYTTD